MIGLMLKESLLFAWHSLVTNKLRSFLSLLGITIGIFTIIFVFTIVDGLESNIRGSLQSLGNNVVYVQKWPWIFANEYPWWKYINRPTPKYHELEELRRRCRSTEALAYRIGARRTVKYRSSSIENAIVGGISHEFYAIKHFDLAAGRYFTRAEAEAGYHLAVIGTKIAEGLFPNEDPTGKVISIAGHKANVIGVIKKEGESLLGMSFDYQVIVPFNFARYFIDEHSERADPTIYAKARPHISNPEMISELTGHMRAIRKVRPKADNNFALNETSLLRQGFDIIFDVTGTAGWIIGGFSILVGGFGIANIMFVSVRERTNIIGIQKSLGARNLFILMQFLSESVLLSTIGGFFGLLLTWILTTLAKDSIDMDISLTGNNIILGFTISILIGVISGFVPAYSASQMDPVEAIRTN
jgi:putative ABC transport system permease protein